MAIFFLAYVFGYPALQLWTLVRCSGGWRIASIACLLPMAPFYCWALFKVFGPKTHGDLSGILILLIAPWPLLYLATLAISHQVATAGGKSPFRQLPR
ncbi:MAG: hypothetical protein ACKVP0_23890 [Pirellulaceae bacterium]